MAIATIISTTVKPRCLMAAPPARSAAAARGRVVAVRLLAPEDLDREGVPPLPSQAGAADGAVVRRAVAAHHAIASGQQRGDLRVPVGEVVGGQLHGRAGGRRCACGCSAPRGRRCPPRRCSRSGWRPSCPPATRLARMRSARSPASRTAWLRLEEMLVLPRLRVCNAATPSRPMDMITTEISASTSVKPRWPARPPRRALDAPIAFDVFSVFMGRRCSDC